MLLYLFIWEHFISRIIEYSFHKVTHQTAIVMVVLLVSISLMVYIGADYIAGKIVEIEV